LEQEKIETTQLPFYEQLSTAVQHALDETRVDRRFNPGEVIAQQGEVWPYLFQVKLGEVHAMKASIEGRSLVPSRLTAGDVFWGLAFFLPNTPMPVTLQAHTEVELSLWAFESLEPVLLDDGILAWQLCQMTVDRMRVASGVIEELAFQPVMARLAGLIMEEFGKEDDYAARTLTLDEMAAHIGSTREVVCRNLQRLVELGLIDMTRTELKITNCDELSHIAKH
jgi:CRP-like cAMP-binding protein